MASIRFRARKKMVFLLLVCGLRMTSADTLQPEIRLGPNMQHLQVGPNMDARGFDLRGTKIVGQDLAGARFDHCDLDGVAIFDCSLKDASFRGAKLTGLAADEDCDVSGADFTEAVINGFRGFKMSEAQVKTTASYRKRDLSDCVLRVAGRMDFGYMDLQRAYFAEGDFTRCSFKNADITQARFGSCSVRWKELSKTRQARSGRFVRMQFMGTNFVDVADFSGMDLSGSHLAWRANVKLQGANISRCQIYHMAVPKTQLVVTKNYVDGNLTGMYFRKVNLSGMDLSRQNLSGTTFTSCDLKDVDFTDSVVTNADFEFAKGLTWDQMKTSWNFKHGRMATVSLPMELDSGRGRR